MAKPFVHTRCALCQSYRPEVLWRLRYTLCCMVVEDRGLQSLYVYDRRTGGYIDRGVL